MGCRKLMRGTMRRCLTFAAILFLSARGPDAQSAPPAARRHAASHAGSPQAAPAAGQPVNQALQNPDSIFPNPNDPPFDPDYNRMPRDPFEHWFQDPFEDMPRDPGPFPFPDPIPFNPSVSNAPW